MIYYGCDKCRFGVVSGELYANLSDSQKLIMFRNGDLELCDCQAGQSRRNRYLSADSETDAEMAKRLRTEAAARRQMKLFEDASVPPKFQNYTFKGYVERASGEPGKQALIAAVKALFAGGAEKPGILAWGASDMGKTGALSPLFMHHLRQGEPGIWIQYNELMAAARQFDGGQVDERIELCKRIEHLFIDDFGDPLTETYATPYTRDVIFRIIDHRCNYRKPTYITSNLDLRQIAEQHHPRLLKRLGELCEVVEVTGKQLGVLSEVAF